MGTLLKKRVLSVVSAENFDNGIVEEINAGQQENIVDEVEGIQNEIAADIQAVENLEGVEAEMSEAIEQGEANIAAMGGEEPAITETTVVNEEGNVETVQEQVEPTLDQNSTDGEVAQATMELENSMESWAGKLQGERLQEVYNSLLSNKQVASFESLVKNPRASYHVSVEGVKDMAKAAGQAIMNFLKSIWEGLKKLFGKILVLCSGLEKKFMALKKEVSEIKPDGVQFGSDDKTKAMLNKISGAANVKFESYFDGSKQIVDVIKGLAVKATQESEDLQTLQKVLSNQAHDWFKTTPKGITQGMCVYGLGKGESPNGESSDFSVALHASISASEGAIKVEMREAPISYNVLSTPKEVFDLMNEVIDSGIKICRGMKSFKEGVDKCLDEMMKSAKDAKVDKKSIKPLANIVNKVSYQISKLPGTLYGTANVAKKLLTGKASEASEDKEESTETK